MSRSRSHENPMFPNRPGGPRLLKSVKPGEPDPLWRAGFVLGEWNVEPLLNRITANGAERSLDPKLIDLLVFFARRAGEVVTRDELLDGVWHDVQVTENTLSQAVSRLRKALGDDTAKPRYIETISKTGYRLVAEVQPNPTASPTPQVVVAADERARPRVRAPRTSRVWAVAVLVAAVPLLAWLMFRPALPPTDFAAVPQVTPELTLAGNQFGPVLSPDGNTVAFAWKAPDAPNFDIWVKPVGGDNPTRITDHADPERLPTWSPDGTAVAFVRFSQETGNCGIYRIPILGNGAGGEGANGGRAERLADCLVGMRTMAWSPDGTTLAVNGIHNMAPNEPASGNRAAAGPQALYLIELASGVARRLTTPPDQSRGDDSVRFSPDGHSLAFVRKHSSHRHDAMVVNLSDGKTKALTQHRWGQLRGVDWNSAGDEVVFSSNRSGAYVLWSVPANGGVATRLPVQDSWVTQPSVSRAGDRLIYRTFRDSVDLWELPINDRGLAHAPAERRVHSTRSERQPAWSPLGAAVAFVSDRSGTNEIWSGNVDGSDLMRHTNLRGPLPAAPAWSPDGQQLVYHAAVDGHSDLFLVDRDSRRSQRLTQDPAEDRNATFSRDGRFIYFASNRSGVFEIWRLSLADDSLEQLTDEGGFMAHESLDGAFVYVARMDQPGIWSMPRDGGEQQHVLADLDLADWGSWLVGRQGIYFVSRRPTTIKFINFATREIVTVHTPDKQMPFLGRALSLSPDGRSLLYSMIDHSDDEVLTVDLAGL